MQGASPELAAMGGGGADGMGGGGEKKSAARGRAAQAPRQLSDEAQALAQDTPSPYAYPTPKPRAILDEDRRINTYPLGIRRTALLYHQMTVRHFEQCRQRVIRLQRKEHHIVQAAFAGHVLQPRFTPALPDNHKQPGPLAQQGRCVDYTLQSLLFTNIARVENDFFIIRQAQLLAQRQSIGGVHVAKTRYF